MDEAVVNSTGTTGWLETTPGSEISVSEMIEDVPTLTVATIIGVTVVVLIAIAIVFVLGVLIDCRQQKLLDQKIGIVKRMKAQRRNGGSSECDNSSIVQNMEEEAVCRPPAHVLRDLP